MTTGLTTVVFVDVEASTALVDRVGDDSGVATVHAQLAVVRERVVPYGGREVKSLGDGLLLTFDSPRSAVAFALAAQRALGTSEPRIKIGINTGEVIDVDGDPMGGAVNAAARISAKAKGGETLVSEVVRQLVGSVPGTSFVDRGRSRLKGFPERWRLYAAMDGSPSSALVTVGRAADMATIEGLVRSAGSGAGQILLLEGEAGIGKTHLVRVTAEAARARSMQVVQARTDELDGRPAALVRSLLDDVPVESRVRHRLAELFGAGAASGDAVDLGFALIESCTDLVEELSAVGPLVLVAEDLHWADELSLRAVAAIAHRVATMPLLLVVTCRPAPRPPLLDRLIELVAATGGHHARVGALDDVAVCALASAQAGAAPGDDLLRRLGTTGGNPLFVTELLRALEDDGALHSRNGVLEVAADALPTSLRQTVVRRLSWLAAPTVELLRLASLLGGSFTLRDLAAVSGRTIVDVAAGLQEATRAAILVGDGDRLSFRHDLLREAIYEDIDSAVRRDLHRAAGQALATMGAPPTQVAHQLSLGARPGDIDAVEWLERAAHDALAYSPAIAISLLEQALELAPSTWQHRSRLEVELVEPLAACGRPAEGEAVARRVLATSPSDDTEYRALRGLAAVLGLRGDLPASIDALHAAAAAAGASRDEACLNRCIAAGISIITGTGDREAHIKLLTAVSADARSNGNATLLAVTQQALGMAALVEGRDEDAVRHTGEAAAMSASGRVGWHSYLSAGEFHAVALLQVDRVDDALAQAFAAHARAERAGATSSLPIGSMCVAGALFLGARWDDAVPVLESCIATAEETGNRAFILYSHGMLADIGLHRSDGTALQRAFDAADAHIASGHSMAGIDWFLSVRARALEADGDFAGALALLGATWQAMEPLRYLIGPRWYAPQLVRLAVIADALDLAADVTAVMEEGARRSSAPTARAAADRCRGLTERNGDVLLNAASIYRSTPFAHHFAGCCEDAASVLADSGRRDEAVAMLEEASRVHEDLGASADLARVDAQLRALGVRRRRSQPKRPTTGLESLTRVECQVAELVAEGLTNPAIGARLFISRRTVETHLSHIYTKCGLTNRAQLAAEIASRAAP